MTVDFTQQSNGNTTGKNIENGILLKAAMHTKNIIAIAGGKGGVGKTLVTAGMSVALAEMDKKTVAVDVDFSGANLHQALGIISPPLTLADLIFKRQKDINKLAIETSIPNLYLIAGNAGTPGIGNLKYWVKQKVFRHLRNIDDKFVKSRKACHREERSDEAIFIKQHVSRHPDCFASLAMTFWDFLRATHSWE